MAGPLLKFISDNDVMLNWHNFCEWKTLKHYSNKTEKVVFYFTNKLLKRDS